MMFDFGLPESAFTQYFTTSNPEGVRLTAREEHLIKAVHPKRRSDFTIGRYCAKQALKLLDFENPEILQGSNKEPIWPAGIVGSISHTNGLAGAVAAKSIHLQSIGLDIEGIGRVLPPMWDMLFTPKEQIYLNRLPVDQQDYYTTLYFSMKESFYKLQFPITNYKMWFTDVEIQEFAGHHTLQIIKQFPERNLLPDLTNLYHTSYQNFLICICCLGI